MEAFLPKTGLQGQVDGMAPHGMDSLENQFQSLGLQQEQVMAPEHPQVLTRMVKTSVAKILRVKNMKRIRSSSL
jgi:hypothetical protein